jgi:hypothetical protein
MKTSAATFGSVRAPGDDGAVPDRAGELIHDSGPAGHPATASAQHGHPEVGGSLRLITLVVFALGRLLKGVPQVPKLAITTTLTVPTMTLAGVECAC